MQFLQHPQGILQLTVVLLHISCQMTSSDYVRMNTKCSRNMRSIRQLDPLLELRHRLEEFLTAQYLHHLDRGHSQAPVRPGLPRNGVSSSSPLRGSPPVSSRKHR